MLTEGETAFAYSMQNADKLQTLEKRVWELEAIIFEIAMQKRMANEFLPERLHNFYMRKSHEDTT